MKLFLVLAALTALTWAQSATTSYTRDVNGRRTALGSSTTDAQGDRTQLFQSVNGRRVPLQETTEKVVRQDARGKVVERITRRFGRNGQVASTERRVIEETPRPNGGKTVKETAYTSDINGRMNESERRLSETRVQGQTTTTDVTIDRPGVSGAFVTDEKHNIVATGPKDNRQSTETVLRRDSGGSLREALREVTQVAVSGQQTTTTTDTYQPDPNQRLDLTRQSVATTTKRDGVDVTETNLYSHYLPGRLQGGGDEMRLQEQQVQERRTAPDGSVTETLSVRRPDLSSPRHLGPLQQLTQTVCVGKCQPEQEQPEVAPPAKPKPEQAAAANSGAQQPHP